MLASEIDAVTFDFYNTLVYHRAGRGRGAMLMEYLREQSLDPAPWTHQVLYDVFEPHGVEYAPHHSPETKRCYFQRLTLRVFEQLNIEVTDAVAAEHADNVWRLLGPASLAVFPDVHQVLTGVRQAGLASAIVSNWQCGLEHFCTDLGLENVFDHVLASAEVGSAKPDPAIFFEAQRRLEVPPHRILHVGDSPVDDFEGGRRAGFQVVLLQRPEPPATPWRPAIRSLNRLPAMLGLE